MPPEKTFRFEAQRITHFIMTISGLRTLRSVKWHEYERSWNNTRSIQYTQEYTNAGQKTNHVVENENEAQHSATTSATQERREHMQRDETQ